MEYPVLVIVDIINTADRSQLLRDSVSCGQIGDEITRQPRVGKTIGIRVVQLTELGALLLSIDDSAGSSATATEDMQVPQARVKRASLCLIFNSCSLS